MFGQKKKPQPPPQEEPDEDDDRMDSGSNLATEPLPRPPAIGQPRPKPPQHAIIEPAPGSLRKAAAKHKSRTKVTAAQLAEAMSER